MYEERLGEEGQKKNEQKSEVEVDVNATEEGCLTIVGRDRNKHKKRGKKRIMKVGRR